MEAWSDGLADALDGYFDARLADADALDEDRLLRASLPARLRNAFCALFTPYL